VRLSSPLFNYAFFPLCRGIERKPGSFSFTTPLPPHFTERTLAALAKAAPTLLSHRLLPSLPSWPLPPPVVSLSTSSNLAPVNGSLLIYTRSRRSALKVRRSRSSHSSRQDYRTDLFLDGNCTRYVDESLTISIHLYNALSVYPLPPARRAHVVSSLSPPSSNILPYSSRQLLRNQEWIPASSGWSVFQVRRLQCPGASRWRRERSFRGPRHFSDVGGGERLRRRPCNADLHAQSASTVLLVPHLAPSSLLQPFPLSLFLRSLLSFPTSPSFRLFRPPDALFLQPHTILTLLPPIRSRADASVEVTLTAGATNMDPGISTAEGSLRWISCWMRRERPGSSSSFRSSIRTQARSKSWIPPFPTFSDTVCAPQLELGRRDSRPHPLPLRAQLERRSSSDRLVDGRNLHRVDEANHRSAP
jgi:hypothetical protein